MSNPGASSLAPSSPASVARARILVAVADASTICTSTLSSSPLRHAAPSWHKCESGTGLSGGWIASHGWRVPTDTSYIIDARLVIYHIRRYACTDIRANLLSVVSEYHACRVVYPLNHNV